ncbi:MAG: cytochrome c [Cyclobacteriaceae bacterium]|jgi:mono/diheme cytochrome c family protein|nr:cytochrome c [Cyclobacteriaceae bacterium]
MKKLAAFPIVLAMLFLSFIMPYTAQDDELAKSMARGKIIYEERCITCHMENGQGIPSVFPPLAGSDYLLQKREASIHAVKFGQEGEITVNGVTYNNFMTPQGLTDTEVADVMNYILNSWGNAGPIVTAEEVAAVKE